MLLINCKVHIELNWIENCIFPSAGDSKKFKIIDAKLHVPIVTLSTKDNVNLRNLRNGGLKGSIYWNEYQTITAKIVNNGTSIYE